MLAYWNAVFAHYWLGAALTLGTYWGGLAYSRMYGQLGVHERAVARYDRDDRTLVFLILGGIVHYLLWFVLLPAWVVFAITRTGQPLVAAYQSKLALEEKRKALEAKEIEKQLKIVEKWLKSPNHDET